MNKTSNVIVAENKIEEKNKRLKWIDVAKGICIIAVILGHMGEDSIKRSVFVFHLTVFFILSGYTLKNTKLDGKYLSDKFKKLMIPYFVTCGFILVADIIIEFFYNRFTIKNASIVASNDLIRFFFASGTINTFGTIKLPGKIGAIWFLPALFFALIISKIIINNVQKYKYRFGISTIIALLGIVIAKFIWLPFSVLSSMLACPFLIFGQFLKDTNLLDKIGIKELLLFLIIHILGYIFDYNNLYFVKAYVKDLVITPIIAITSSLFIIKLSMYGQKLRPLAYIGKNSLYFFCIHLFMLDSFKWCLLMFYDITGFEKKYYYGFILHFIVCLIGTFIINFIKKQILIYKKEAIVSKDGRNLTIDVIRTICIIAIIIGHSTIDSSLKKIIFSFHMMAFIFISGYLYKSNTDSLFKRLFKEIKRLIIPTIIFSAFYIVNNHYGYMQEIKNLIFSMSYSKKIFNDYASIGPYYFVLLLFIVKIFYIVIDKLTSKYKDNNRRVITSFMICFILSIIGVAIGENEYWLPWSCDIALYCVIFFHIGHIFKEYDLINEILKRKYLYFLFVPIWAFMIYNGSMEISIRKYEPYGLVILGSLCGILTLFIFSNAISNRIGKLGNTITRLIGSGTIYILIIHAVFNGNIINFVYKIGLEKVNVYNLVASLTIQIVLGVALSSIIANLKTIKTKKIGEKKAINA